jgi:large subunit ribosomal protein L10
MHKDKKELVVAELTERLRGSQTLLVADYRGLTMTEIDALRGELLKHGARFSVVKNTLILTIRGGLLEGRSMNGDEVESLAKLPSADAVRAQVLGAITAPLTLIVGLFAAPLQNLIGLIDARIEQLGGSGDAESPPEGAPGPDAEVEPEAGPEGAEPEAVAPAQETPDPELTETEA